MPTNSGNFPKQSGTTQKHFFYSYREQIIDVSDPPVTRETSGGHWSRTSSVTPGYFRITRRKPRGSLPMNAFSYDAEEHHGSSGIDRVKTTQLFSGDVETVIQEEVGFFINDANDLLQSTDPSIFVDLDLKAKAKLLSGLKQQTVNLAVAVGEGRQTVNLLTQKAMQIARSGLALRKLDFAGAAKALGVPPRGDASRRSRYQTVAQNWLELQYGWKPLMSDIYGAAEFLARQNYYQIRSRLRSSSSRPDTRVVLDVQPTRIVNTTRSNTYTVTYVVYFSEPHGGNPATSLGLTNPLSVAWELVPFSFVADWFLPLGDYFNNVDSTIGATFVKGCVTRFWKGQAVQTVDGKTVTVGTRTDEYDIRKKFSSFGVHCSRSVLTDFPSNSFPRFKNPFSALHTANALALIAQVFSKSPVKQNLRI
jgi:hypothetical protein